MVRERGRQTTKKLMTKNHLFLCRFVYLLFIFISLSFCPYIFFSFTYFLILFSLAYVFSSTTPPPLSLSLFLDHYWMNTLLITMIVLKPWTWIQLLQSAVHFHRLAFAGAYDSVAAMDSVIFYYIRGRLFAKQCKKELLEFSPV